MTVLLVSQEGISVILCTAKRSLPHDDNSPVTRPPGNGLALLEQTECEDGFFSPETNQHSSEDQ